MRKLKLQLESLQVESFEVSADSPLRGTVDGHLAPPTPTCTFECSVDPLNTCHTCEGASCKFTC